MITDLLEADVNGNLPMTSAMPVEESDGPPREGSENEKLLQKTSLLTYLSDRPKLVSFTSEQPNWEFTHCNNCNVAAF